MDWIIMTVGGLCIALVIAGLSFLFWQTSTAKAKRDTFKALDRAAPHVSAALEKIQREQRRERQ